MSLFQCAKCGCKENTALSAQAFSMSAYYDWTGIEEFRQLPLCSACGPKKFVTGNPTPQQGWHGKFARKFLPKGMFKTDSRGNLEHKDRPGVGTEPYTLREESPEVYDPVTQTYKLPESDGLA